MQNFYNPISYLVAEELEAETIEAESLVGSFKGAEAELQAEADKWHATNDFECVTW